MTWLSKSSFTLHLLTPFLLKSLHCLFWFSPIIYLLPAEICSTKEHWRVGPGLWVLMTWLCVLLSGLVVLYSGSELASVRSPMQQVNNTMINQISCSSIYWLFWYFMKKKKKRSLNYTTPLERSFLAFSLNLDSTTRNLYKSVWGEISGGGDVIYT